MSNILNKIFYHMHHHRDLKIYPAHKGYVWMLGETEREKGKKPKEKGRE